MGCNGMGRKPTEEELFIPFGRYGRGPQAPFPADEILVGREKERAKLLDLLLSVGPRGAYLVTGHRGSGKTSFVDYCLREYEENLYGRFLQRNIGRTWLWDRLGLVLLAALLLFIGLLLTETLAELLAGPLSAIQWDPARFRLPASIIALVLVLLLSYPLFLAQASFRGAFALHDETAYGWLRRVAVPTSIMIVAFWLPRTSPGLSLAQLLLVGSHLFLFHTLIFWTASRFDRKEESPVDSPVESIRQTESWKKKWASASAILVSLVAWGCDAYPKDVGRCVFLSLMAFGVSLLIRMLPELYSRNPGRPRTTKALAVSARWIGAAAAWLTLVALGVLYLDIDRGYGWALVAAGLYLSVVLVALAVFAARPLRFQPQPRRFLLFKGFVLTVVGVQYLDPLATLVRNDSLELVEASVFPLAALRSLPVFGPRLETWSKPAFATVAGDMTWLVIALVLLSLIFLIEYEWIVRPYSAAREDLCLHDSSPALATKRTKGFSAARHRFREMLQATFFWKIYRRWLPLMIVRVNLGFHELDQRLVVEAMLTGLRDQFRRLFLHWSGSFTAVRWLLGLVLVAILALWAGDRWFSVREDLGTGPPVGCETILELSDQRFTPQWLACTVGDGALMRALRWAPLLETEELRGEAERSPNTLQLLFGLRVENDWRRSEVLDVRLYHGIILLLFLGGIGLASRWWRPLPYKEIDARMTRVLDGLSGRLREESRPDRVSAWISALRGKEMVEAKESGPFDPRTVELHFLTILQDLQDARLRLPFGVTKRVTLPVPEVLFVFDELDKIGVASRTLTEEGDEVSESAREPLDQERERSRALHQLFSDLKNLVSAGDARFVFVGGRNLHDEWLADSTARRPLLSNIFMAEIYIPSLLVDAAGADPNLQTSTYPPGVEAFVRRQLFRAKVLHGSWAQRRTRPQYSLGLIEMRPDAFVQEPFATESEDADIERIWPPLAIKSSREPEKEIENHEEFYADLMAFFTYRSKGNVKRLRELLAEFVEPAGRVAVDSDHSKVGHLYDCDHVLRFADVDRFRISLVAELYGTLRPELDARLRLVDDKMSQAMLYLADFLLKFHRRAFSWANIERVDELVHIHRAPDLRGTMHRVLALWEDRYLHRIRNGMYNLRFNSEFGRELEYLSKASDEELAVLNFTLDESHFLKAIYRSRYRVLGEEDGEDFIAGLAELYEFDEEYEVARYFLKRALSVLDERLEETIGGDPFSETVVQQVIAGTAGGGESARTRLSYAIARLRLMVQIGMTFEKSRVFESALIEYREARTLAESVVRALLVGPSFRRLPADGYVACLKHLHILVQPLFAEAWLAEKAVSGVDVAPGILEAGLVRLRRLFPFVWSEAPKWPVDVANSLDIRHSNFSLVMAELENKTGDLFFFKGRQLVSEDRLDEWTNGDQPRDRWGAEGYSMRALYHYGLALHELRRYNAYRRKTSAVKFFYPMKKLSDDRDVTSWSTVERDMWPHAVLRAAAGYLSDLTDSLIARFTFVGLLYEMKLVRPQRRKRGDLRAVLDDAYDHFVCWMETRTTVLAGREKVAPPAVGQMPTEIDLEYDRRRWSELCGLLLPSLSGFDTALHDWFGRPRRRSSSPELIVAGHRNSGFERLATGLLLGMVAARILARGGQRHAAMRQYVRVAETVASLLWSCWALQRVHELGDQGGRLESLHALATRVIPGPPERILFFADLGAVGAFALTEADRISQGGLPEERPPWNAPVVAASLRLAVQGTCPELAMPELEALLGRWLLQDRAVRSEALPGLLAQRLRTRPYPILGRLTTLKVLIDHSILAKTGVGERSDRIDLLVDLEDSYASPLHFTRFHSGMTLGMAVLLADEKRESIRGLAIRHLNESREVYTMRNAYYQAIADMYYLYDDFNDRDVHANHALQMANTELATYLLRHLDLRDKVPPAD